MRFWDGEKRLEALLGIFRREIDLIELEGSIQTKVRYNLQRGQREIYLREQLKAIQSELNIDESGDEESDEYYTRIEEAKLPPRWPNGCTRRTPSWRGCLSVRPKRP